VHDDPARGGIARKLNLNVFMRGNSSVVRRVTSARQRRGCCKREVSVVRSVRTHYRCGAPILIPLTKRLRAALQDVRLSARREG
jgi:hypothetical protein